VGEIDKSCDPLRTISLRGDDLIVARVLDAMVVAGIGLMGHAFFTLAEFAVRPWSVDPTSLYAAAQIARSVTLMFWFFSGFMLLFGDNWQLIRVVGVGIFASGSFGALSLIVVRAPHTPDHLVRDLISHVPYLVGATLISLLWRWLVGERNRDVVFWATSIGITALWVSLGCYVLAVARDPKGTTATATDGWALASYVGYLLGLVGGMVCLWLATVWTRADVLQIEPPPEPEPEEDESPGPWDEFEPEE